MLDKTKIIGVRFTETEKDEINKFARAYGMDMSNFVRMCVFDKMRNNKVLEDIRLENSL